MPLRIRNEDKWRPWVNEAAAEHPRYGPARIRSEIEQRELREAERDARPADLDTPSERTIGRWLREFRALGEREQMPYRLYSWPEAMERGALPWEASEELFDLTRWLTCLPHDRLTIQRAQWYWRLTLAAPNQPPSERYFTAHMLAVADAMPDDSILRRVEAALHEGDLTAVRSFYQGHDARRMEEDE